MQDDGNLAVRVVDRLRERLAEAKRLASFDFKVHAVDGGTDIRGVGTAVVLHATTGLDAEQPTDFGSGFAFTPLSFFTRSSSHHERFQGGVLSVVAAAAAGGGFESFFA